MQEDLRVIYCMCACLCVCAYMRVWLHPITCTITLVATKQKKNLNKLPNLVKHFLHGSYKCATTFSTHGLFPWSAPSNICISPFSHASNKIQHFVQYDFILCICLILCSSVFLKLFCKCMSLPAHIFQSC